MCRTRLLAPTAFSGATAPTKAPANNVWRFSPKLPKHRQPAAHHHRQHAENPLLHELDQALKAAKGQHPAARLVSEEPLREPGQSPCQCHVLRDSSPNALN
jgi:hypothetical protein